MQEYGAEASLTEIMVNTIANTIKALIIDLIFFFLFSIEFVFPLSSSSVD
ncbi:hypothetical protein SBDP1_120024 [Syntrophobacter sp. SbD1]|nr:hypothetical protein SBDP1_120024 [Syntrophobacter sp. SbD1]